MKRKGWYTTMMNINYSATTKELSNKLDTTVNAVNAARQEKRWTDAELFSENVKSLVKETNAAIIEDTSKAFVAIFENDGPAAFVKAYFSDWFAPKYVTKDNDGVMTVDFGKPVHVLMSHIDKISKRKIAARGDWRDWLSIYADNAARGKAQNAKGEKAKFGKTPLPSHLLEKRDNAEKFWSGCGSSDLCKQLNAVVRMMFPADFQPDFRLLSADQDSVASDIYRNKDIHAMDGKTYTYAKTATAEASILQSVNTRMNDLAINFVTGFKEKESKKNAPQKDEAKATAPTKGGKTDSKPVPAENTAA